MKITGDFGLKPDPIFAPDESLYRRINPDYIYNGNCVLGNALEDIQERHPSCSFNRSKYSEPKDVLDASHPEDNRIAHLVVSNLPGPQPHPKDPKVLYGYRVEHLPEEANYSHTEVQVTKQGTQAPRLGSAELRKHLREALAEKMSVLDPAQYEVTLKPVKER